MKEAEQLLSEVDELLRRASRAAVQLDGAAMTEVTAELDALANRIASSRVDANLMQRVRQGVQQFSDLCQLLSGTLGEVLGHRSGERYQQSGRTDSSCAAPLLMKRYG